MFHRCWAEISLSALEHNLNFVRQLVGPSVQILFPVKADAYGHGLEKMAVSSAQNGVTWLGVANIEEAARIRRVLPDIPILILGLSFSGEFESLLDMRVSTVAADLVFIQTLNKVAAEKGVKARIHLKVDTGMGRIGVWHEEALELIEQVAQLPHIELEGILTHFPAPEKPDDLFTRVQISHFEQLLKSCKQKGVQFKFIHLANSSGVVNYPESHQFLVRPGIMVYGVQANETPQDLRPLLQLKSKIIYLKKVKPGRSISYGRTYVADKETQIATLPIGYADGFPRSLSNKAEVLIQGKRCPVVGRVTMDQIMVDVGLEATCKVGDEVTLIGQDTNEQIRVEELATWANTIPYEILTNLGDRIHRVYV